MSDEDQNDSRYVLVIIKRKLPMTFGPFLTRADAEYAAMDYYGTAITGASMRDEFLITELRSGDQMPPSTA